MAGVDLGSATAEQLMSEVAHRLGLHATFTSSPCKPVVISGPSGVGKGTLVNLIMQKHPDDYGFSVSHTTRQPRNKERDGVEYHFVSKDQFMKEVADGKFIEWANVHGNYYGTAKSSVQDVQKAGKIPLVEIDVQGSMQLFSGGKLPDAKFYFITPPSMSVLEERLRGRGTETEEVISLRVKNAYEELAKARQSDVYDVFLTNNHLTDTLSVFQALLEPNRCNCSRARAMLGPRMEALQKQMQKVQEGNK